MRRKIAVIEDDKTILDLVIFNLEKEGFEVEGYSSGIDGLNALLKRPADLLLLDLMLPDIDGLDICRDLRKNERTKSMPVIILTAKGEETDRVVGLEVGADDYVVKPFSPRELIARIKAVLRRFEPDERTAVIKYGALAIDRRKYSVFERDKEIFLTATEFKILEMLVRSPGRVFTRNDLLEILDKMVLDRNIDVHITNLRKKLGPAGALIKTMRGIGYKIEQ